MLKQNPQRYSRDGDEVSISAGPGVAPLRIPLGRELPLEPILAADGVIVRTGGRWLCSPKTAADLAAARAIDPHYWHSAGGLVNGAVMGRSVPIIEVRLEGLEGLAISQSFALRQAGCREVDWPYDDPGTVPAGVLEQINWTISSTGSRPTDRWTLSDLGLGADYSYETLKIAPPAETGRIDYESIGEIVNRVSARMYDLGQDFNRIKRVYFFGELPTGSLPQQSSQLNEIPPAGPEPDRQRLIRQTRLVRVDPAPTDRQNLAGDIVSAVGASDSGAVGDRPEAPAAPAPEERRRGAVGTAVDIGTGVIGITTPIGLIARGLRRLFGRR
jgi:hypothetical protein